MMAPNSGTNAIRAGDILVERTTVLPGPLRFARESTGDAWARVADKASVGQLEQGLTDAGWTFFYMAGTVTSTAFGFEKQGLPQKALQRLFTAAKRQGCNCLEIDDVATHSWLGMPYVRVSAHSRHIQPGRLFSSASSAAPGGGTQ